MLKKLSILLLMLCAPVFIFTSGSSTLLGRPCCGLSIRLSLLAIFNTLFWVYANYFHKKTDKTRKYSKSAIFVLSENGCRRLPVTQASKALTLRASLRFCCRYCVPRMCCSKYSTFCETRYLANFRWASVSTTAATLTYHEFTNEKLQSTIAHNNVQHRKLHHYKICIMPNMTHNQHSLVIYMLLLKVNLHGTILAHATSLQYKKSWRIVEADTWSWSLPYFSHLLHLPPRRTPL